MYKIVSSLGSMPELHEQQISMRRACPSNEEEIGKNPNSGRRTEFVRPVSVLILK